MFWFVLIGLALALIHALPLLARLWSVAGGEQQAGELSLLALAVPGLVKWHFAGESDGDLAAIALLGSLPCAIGLVLGWKAGGRADDRRYAMLATSCGLLLELAAGLVVPLWQLPLAMAGVAIAMLGFGRLAADWRIERIACGFGFGAVLALFATMADAGEMRALVAGPVAGVVAHAVVRWAGMAALALIFAMVLKDRLLQAAAQIAAGLFAYGLLAQMVPGAWLPLVPGLAGAGLLLAGRRLGWERSAFGAGSLVAVAGGWGFVPLVLWLASALASLSGWPMVLDAALDAATVVKRLAMPALVLGGALWRIRQQLSGEVWRRGLIAAAVVGGIALHALYRLGFAQVFGSDFVRTGLGQRLIWEALLIGGGWVALRFGAPRWALGLAGAGSAHALWYTLVLHNPLWAAQAVGAAPLVNLLAPAFAVLPAGYGVMVRALPTRLPLLERAVQLAAMVLVAGFAWASLRQLFHGTLLVEGGVLPFENILRSLLLLALAIGYLQWGIRRHRHDWRIASLVLMLAAVGKVFLFDASGLGGLLRIASFVTLGFSLIGIGWLYSRQLAQSKAWEPDR